MKITFNPPLVLKDGEQIGHVDADNVLWLHKKPSGPILGAIRVAINQPGASYKLTTFPPDDAQGEPAMGSGVFPIETKAETQAGSVMASPPAPPSLPPEVWEDDGKLWTRNPARDGWRDNATLIHLKA